MTEATNNNSRLTRLDTANERIDRDAARKLMDSESAGI